MKTNNEFFEGKLDPIMDKLKEIENILYPQPSNQVSSEKSETDNVLSIDKNQFTNLYKEKEEKEGVDVSFVFRSVNILYKLIDFLAILDREKSKIQSNKEEINHKLIDIKQQIIGFVSSERLLIENEADPELETGTAISSPKSLGKTEKKPISLLYKMAASAQNNFSLEIFNSLIESCNDLSKRKDIIEIMAKDNTLSSEPDMLATFDLLAQKNIPTPRPEVIQTMINHPRTNSGKNASKLAKSLFFHKGDFKIIDFILREKTPTNNDKKRQLWLEQEYLKSIFQTKESLSDQDFVKYTKCLIEINQDELLEELLSNQLDGSEKLERIFNHTEILNLAVEKKLTKTFEILINAGFDPAKHPQDQLNVLAFACKNQGKIFLESYVKTIKTKFGENKLSEIINEKDINGKTPLTHSIEGKGYIDSIDFLIKNGANPQENHLQNLEIALKKSHAGALDYLLKNTEVEEKEFETIAKEAINKSDYVIDKILLRHIKNQETIDELNKQIAEKIENLTKEDIFRICQTDGEDSFQSYVEKMSTKFTEYNLQSELASLDEHNKTPLYYAINNNAYNRLINELIKNEADPNFIGYETDELSPKMNALSLAIKNKEDKTVELLLKSGKLSEEVIQKGFNDLAKEENNRITLIESFIENLTNDSLKNAPIDCLKIILQRTLEAQLEQCATKIMSCQNKEFATKIDELFIESIEKADVTMVKNLTDYGVKNYLPKSVNLNSAQNSNQDYLIPENSPIHNHGLPISDVRYYNQNLAKDYFQIIFDLPENQETKSNIKSILEILLKKDFKPNKDDANFTKKLKEFGVKYTNPDICHFSCSIS